jgi:arylsulfatase A-like enzyme
MESSSVVSFSSLADGKTLKVHLDGYNQLPYLTGQQPSRARSEYIYFNDDGDLVALRNDNWKIVFEEQRVNGTLRIWAEPFTKLRLPKIFNLRSDPYERADITLNSIKKPRTTRPVTRPFLKVWRFLARPRIVKLLLVAGRDLVPNKLIDLFGKPPVTFR